MMRLNPPWREDAAWVQLILACAAEGISVRAVGGAVRDTLLMRDVGDIDAATATPAEQVMEKLARHGIKTVPTGLAHGTVTAVFEGRVIEITTLRCDVQTDGRHAVIAQTDSWEEDAARRDFTMNALYWDVDGTVYDYHDGASDALAGRIRFIGDAAARIREDALRILRFFRFLATHGEPPIDEEALAACATHAVMVDGLSGERIAQEMRKLLRASNPAISLRLMVGAGVAARVFGADIMPQHMIRLGMLEQRTRVQTSIWTRLLVLVQRDAAAISYVSERWKLSRKEAQILQMMLSLPRFSVDAPRHIHTRILRLHGLDIYMDWLLMEATLQQGIDVAPYMALAQQFVTPIFPVSASDLIARGMSEGKPLGDALAALEAVWEESDYSLNKETLLATL